MNLRTFVEVVIRAFLISNALNIAYYFSKILTVFSCQHNGGGICWFAPTLGKDGLKLEALNWRVE